MHERIALIAWNSPGTAPVEALAADLAAAGFDTVLIADAETAPVAEIASTCALHGLATWLVLSPDEQGAPLFATDATPPLAPWLVDGDVALDPRRPPLSVRAGPVVDVDGTTWRARIAGATEAGVTGFLCKDADRLPSTLWSMLLVPAGAIATTWTAWTVALDGSAIAALVDCGFERVCNSAAWWDGRSGWLVDESHRLQPAGILSFAADPFARGPVEGLSVANRLAVAALTCDALLIAHDLFRDDAAMREQVVAINRWVGARVAQGSISAGALRITSGADAPISVVVRSTTYDLRAADAVEVLLINPSPARDASVGGASVTTAVGGFGAFEQILPAASTSRLDPTLPVVLAAGEIRVFRATRLPVVQRSVPPTRRSAEAALLMPRLAIEAITPVVDGGRFPVKRTVGEPARVEADIVIDGHEKLGASLLYRAVGDREWRQVRMEPIGNDRFAASFPLHRIGRHEFTIEAWRDAFATYRNELDKKSAAGLDVTLELTEGGLLVDHALAHAKTLKRPGLVRRLGALVKTLSTSTPSADHEAMIARVAALLSSQTLADMQDADHRAFATRPEAVFPIDADRSEASFASWYELFPRSLGNAPGAEASHHGRFDDVIDRLPAVRAMGFDVLYFPPIHPIGTRNRKGRNNSLTTQDGDPGSPYAIGSADGGHDALHPQLGTFEDFERLRNAALDNGLELALDFAIQCSPDHPWLEKHPGWFAWRPDGSLRYAENPPKKYEDIVNVDFYGEGRRGDAAPALWAALRDVILLWVGHGVRIFRVDNPHTKPLPFWEWMIGEVRAKYPDTIFLSEAFTRPKVMYRLAKVGFSQSYTYFTWRHTKQEFIDYMTELTGPESRESLHAAPRDFFRPNFFVNTPDINPVFLQRSGRAGFLIRAALAATLSGLWGIYSGFELCEATPVPGKEDYLDSEKYQLRAWDWQRPGNIIAEITALNRIRKENPALRTHLGLRFESVFDPNILFFMKATEDRSNVILVAINLDPYGVHEADFEIPLWAWGRPDDAGVDVTDLLDGHRFRWQGKVQRMRLDPGVNPYAIWRLAL